MNELKIKRFISEKMKILFRTISIIWTCDAQIFLPCEIPKVVAIWAMATTSV